MAYRGGYNNNKRKRDRSDDLELYFGGGMFRPENTAKVAARARMDVEQIREALDSAAKDSALDGKAVVMLLKSKSDKADFWLAFCGVSEEDASKSKGRPSKKSGRGRDRDDDRDDDDDDDARPVSRKKKQRTSRDKDDDVDDDGGGKKKEDDDDDDGGWD